MAHETFTDCIEACNRCSATCEHCASACLQEEDIKALARCIELDLDCSLLCVVTAKLLSRGSEEGFHLARHCAEVCHRCADECRKHDMAHCQECADACAECAEECEKVAKQLVH